MDENNFPASNFPQEPETETRGIRPSNEAEGDKPWREAESDAEVELEMEFDVDQLPEQEEDEAGEIRPGRHFLLRLGAVIILLVFVAFSYAWLPLVWPPRWDFLQQDRALSTETLVKKSKPAVVSIQATNLDGLPGSSRNGTGFNTLSSGLVVTNRHVVEGAASVEISFSDERRFFSRDLSIIKGYDLAVIRFKGENLPVLPLVSNRMPKVGETVTIIGNPLGFRGVSTRGEVKGFIPGGEAGALVLAIVATVEPGSSGSPVLDAEGRVVGIVYATGSIKLNGKEENCALAIPASALEMK